MYLGRKILAVITARGGSKGVPRKNIRDLNGKPVLWYSLTSCLQSKLLTCTVVSSESEEILAMARSIGGDKVVVKRPESMARDESPSIDAIQHAVKTVEARDNTTFDYVALVQPSTPFIRSEDIDSCLKILIDKKADTVVSVCGAKDSHLVKMKKIDDQGKLVPYLESLEETTFRRQDLPSVYQRNGGIYANTREMIMEKNSYHGTIGTCYPYIMSELRSVDINTMLDFYLAETVAKVLEKGEEAC